MTQSCEGLENFTKLFTLQRCLVLESKRQKASKRDYLKEKIIEIVLKVNFYSDLIQL